MTLHYESNWHIVCKIAINYPVSLSLKTTLLNIIVHLMLQSLRAVHRDIRKHYVCMTAGTFEGQKLHVLRFFWKLFFNLNTEIRSLSFTVFCYVNAIICNASWNLVNTKDAITDLIIFYNCLFDTYWKKNNINIFRIKRKICNMLNLFTEGTF